MVRKLSIPSGKENTGGAREEESQSYDEELNRGPSLWKAPESDHAESDEESGGDPKGRATSSFHSV